MLSRTLSSQDIKKLATYSEYINGASWIVSCVSLAVLFFYPLHGIGMLVFGCFLASHSKSPGTLLQLIDIKLTLEEIATHLDEAQRKVLP